MTRFQPIAKVLLFVSTGLFLATRLMNGTLNFYIHPRYNWLTAATAVGLIAVGVVYAYKNWTLILTGESDDHHHHDHDHDHHGHSHDVSWLGLLILAIPVVLGVLVQPQPLGANALENRDIGVSAVSSARAPEASNLASIPNAGERNIMDWTTLFRQSDDLAEFNGEEAHVVGFVYRDDRFAEDEFMVSRFTVSCCVADAMPIGLIVEWPDSAEIPDDEWVEVTGTIEMGEFDGFEYPLLIADEVVPTTTPNQPYLYQ